MMLETNTRESVTLQEEIEMCKKYLEIESLRFNKVFTFRFNIDDGLETEDLLIPHFMLQPLIENAIWHGLLPKEGEKEVVISFTKGDDKSLICIVDDNGVGRAEAQKRRSPKKKSLALAFIEQRLQLFSKLKNGSYFLEVFDKISDEGKPLGTRVTICIPLLTVKEHETSDYN
jgi:LytS/YehU family sensor histidine kinase